MYVSNGEGPRMILILNLDIGPMSDCFGMIYFIWVQKLGEPVLLLIFFVYCSEI